MEVTSGFLIVKTFERMCREYPINFEKYRQVHPEKTLAPIALEQMPGKYRGVARNPIEPWIEAFSGAGLFDEPTEQELAASLFMTELRDAGKSQSFFIFEQEDARRLYDMIRPPVEREIIWARRMDRDDTPPPESAILGYEPIDLEGDFTSLIADVAFFRITLNVTIDDPDGSRHRGHYSRFNKFGLFDTPAHAGEYVSSFPRLPECERPRYVVEVRALV